MFPAPYNTEAFRITDASDCGGTDCVNPVGYSYWRNSNAHEGSNDMLIFLSLNSQKGGSGPTLFRLDKATDSMTKVGPLFPTTSKFSGRSGDGWYFSASRANQLYINDGPKLLRYDVTTHNFETVFDLTGEFGRDREVWQMHSSNDDLVHSATMRAKGTGTFLGCLVFNEITGQFSYFSKKGTYDECHIDKSGHYLLILEKVDGVCVSFAGHRGSAVARRSGGARMVVVVAERGNLDDHRVVTLAAAAVVLRTYLDDCRCGWRGCLRRAGIADE